MKQAKRLVALAAAVLMGTLVALGTAGSASAANINACTVVWEYHSMQTPTPADSGGKDAWINAKCNGTVIYKVNFNAYGEELRLEDRLSDGYAAKANVRVYNTSGTLVDSDTFKNAGSKTYNLGTPDGSGDIAEGFTVYIQLCIDTVACGASWARGIA